MKSEINKVSSVICMHIKQDPNIQIIYNFIRKIADQKLSLVYLYDISTKIKMELLYNK